MKHNNQQQEHTAGRQFYVALIVLSIIRNKGRTGTQEIQRILADKGFEFSLRTIQRWLLDAKKNGIPLCCDESVPRGWWWKKEMNNEELALVETIQAVKDAA